MVQVVNVATGEIMELADRTPQEIKNSWLEITQNIKALERAKDKLKPKVEALLDERGTYDFGDYAFRRSVVQRMNYDKAELRKALDDDTFDVLMVPDKPRIDAYIKENLNELGNKSTELRNSMVAVGEPYSTLRLEKIK